MTWKSSSAVRAWNAASSSVSACIRVSGTYLPPNLPNLPNESGLWSITDPFSSLVCSCNGRTEAGSLVREQETEEGVLEAEEEGGKVTSFSKFEGKWEDGYASLGMGSNLEEELRLVMEEAMWDFPIDVEGLFWKEVKKVIGCLEFIWIMGMGIWGFCLYAEKKRAQKKAQEDYSQGFSWFDILYFFLKKNRKSYMDLMDGWLDACGQLAMWGSLTAKCDIFFLSKFGFVVHRTFFFWVATSNILGYEKYLLTIC